MPISGQCGKCSTTLKVNDSLAGKRGKCPKCGAIVIIPGFSLAEATVDQMANELFRRGKSAAIIYFDTPTNRNYNLEDVPDTVVQCCGSDDMATEQLHQVVRGLAKLSERQQAAKLNLGEQSKIPYDLKGDQLGMSLADFKQKYHRPIQGHHKPAPFTSEDAPGKSIDMLLTEPWHSGAGIIHGSPIYPFERFNGKRLTVGGVDVDLLIYKFVDGKLYQIAAYFDTRDFELLRRALVDRYGEPTKEEKKPAHAFWWNGCSSISMRRGKINPQEYSRLLFTSDELMSVVLTRSPKSSDDL
ncbi:MAG: hypothetical protein IT424_05935 [Pirellulales bacterium]|nr:hypothetical protein [Pirellulales bacterium]